MKTIKTLTVVVALATLACGREGPYTRTVAAQPAPTTSATTTPAPSAVPTARPAPTAAPATPAPTANAPSSAALSQATLEQTLLTAAELGSGWAKSSPDGSGESGGPEFEMCGESIEDAHPPLVVATVDYENESLFRFINLSSESYRSDASAAASFRDARDQVARCPTWTETDDDGTTYTFHITRATLPKIGDESLGFDIHMVISGQMNGQTMTAEAKGFAVGARLGRSAVGHFHMEMGVLGEPTIERADSVAILRKAVQKFERVTEISA